MNAIHIEISPIVLSDDMDEQAAITLKTKLLEDQIRQLFVDVGIEVTVTRRRIWPMVAAPVTQIPRMPKGTAPALLAAAIKVFSAANVTEMLIGEIVARMQAAGVTINSAAPEKYLSTLLSGSPLAKSLGNKMWALVQPQSEASQHVGDIEVAAQPQPEAHEVANLAEQPPTPVDLESGAEEAAQPASEGEDLTAAVPTDRTPEPGIRQRRHSRAA